MEKSIHIYNPLNRGKGVGRRTGKVIEKKRNVNNGMDNFEDYLSASDAEQSLSVTRLSPLSARENLSNMSISTHHAENNKAQTVDSTAGTFKEGSLMQVSNGEKMVGLFTRNSKFGRRTGKVIQKKRNVNNGVDNFDDYLSASDIEKTLNVTDASFLLAKEGCDNVSVHTINDELKKPKSQLSEAKKTKAETQVHKDESHSGSLHQVPQEGKMSNLPTRNSRFGRRTGKDLLTGKEHMDLKNFSNYFSDCQDETMSLDPTPPRAKPKTPDSRSSSSGPDVSISGQNSNGSKAARPRDDKTTELVKVCYEEDPLGALSSRQKLPPASSGSSRRRSASVQRAQESSQDEFADVDSNVEDVRDSKRKNKFSRSSSLQNKAIRNSAKVNAQAQSPSNVKVGQKKDVEDRHSFCQQKENSAYGDLVSVSRVGNDSQDKKVKKQIGLKTEQQKDDVCNKSGTFDRGKSSASITNSEQSDKAGVTKKLNQHSGKLTNKRSLNRSNIDVKEQLGEADNTEKPNQHSGIITPKTDLNRSDVGVQKQSDEAGVTEKSNQHSGNAKQKSLNRSSMGAKDKTSPSPATGFHETRQFVLMAKSTASNKVSDTGESVPDTIESNTDFVGKASKSGLWQRMGSNQPGTNHHGSESRLGQNKSLVRKRLQLDERSPGLETALSPELTDTEKASVFVREQSRSRSAKKDRHLNEKSAELPDKHEILNTSRATNRSSGLARDNSVHRKTELEKGLNSQPSDYPSLTSEDHIKEQTKDTQRKSSLQASKISTNKHIASPMETNGEFLSIASKSVLTRQSNVSTEEDGSHGKRERNRKKSKPEPNEDSNVLLGPIKSDFEEKSFVCVSSDLPHQNGSREEEKRSVLGANSSKRKEKASDSDNKSVFMSLSTRSRVSSTNSQRNNVAEGLKTRKSGTLQNKKATVAKAEEDFEPEPVFMSISSRKSEPSTSGAIDKTVDISRKPSKHEKEAVAREADTSVSKEIPLHISVSSEKGSNPGERGAFKQPSAVSNKQSRRKRKGITSETDLEQTSSSGESNHLQSAEAGIRKKIKKSKQAKKGNSDLSDPSTTESEPAQPAKASMGEKGKKQAGAKDVQNNSSSESKRRMKSGESSMKKGSENSVNTASKEDENLVGKPSSSSETDGLLKSEARVSVIKTIGSSVAPETEKNESPTGDNFVMNIPSRSSFASTELGDTPKTGNRRKYKNARRKMFSSPIPEVVFNSDEDQLNKVPVAEEKSVKEKKTKKKIELRRNARDVMKKSKSVRGRAAKENKKTPRKVTLPSRKTAKMLHVPTTKESDVNEVADSPPVAKPPELEVLEPLEKVSENLASSQQQQRSQVVYEGINEDGAGAEDRILSTIHDVAHGVGHENSCDNGEAGKEHGVDKMVDIAVTYTEPLKTFSGKKRSKAEVSGGRRSSVKSARLEDVAYDDMSSPITLRLIDSLPNVTPQSGVSFRRSRTFVSMPEDDSPDENSPVTLRLIDSLPNVTPKSGVSFRRSRNFTSLQENSVDCSPDPYKFELQRQQAVMADSTPCGRVGRETGGLTSCLRDSSVVRPRNKGRKVRISNVIDSRAAEMHAEKSLMATELPSTTLLSPSSSPVHYAETTHSGDPHTEQPSLKLPDLSHFIVRPQSNETNGLRRSNRTRVKPVAAYKGERVVYKRDSTGYGLVVDAIQPSIGEAKIRANEEKRRKNMRKKRLRAMHVPAKPNKRLSTHVPDLSLDMTSSNTLPAVNPETEEEVFIEIVSRRADVSWKGPELSPVIDTDALAGCIQLDEPSFSTGEIHIRALAEKAYEKTVQTLIFIVNHGKVCLTINEKSTVVETGDDFFIPRGSAYGIKNLRRDVAKLHFVNLKDNR